MSLPTPLTRALHLALREAVLEFRETDRHRRPSTSVHVGLPGRHAASYVVPVPTAGTAPGPGLATDVVGALLQRARRELDAVPGSGPGALAEPAPVPLAWLTRAGSLAVHDADVLWAAASRAAYAEAGLPATFVVVTRDGWVDHVSGASRTWRRLRRRSGAAGPRP